MQDKHQQRSSDQDKRKNHRLRIGEMATVPLL
jgi:hypothetical protein